MTLVPVAEALARLLADAAPVGEEFVGIAEAGERVLAREIVALRRQPPFDVSAMDGYAVRARDIAGPSATLEIVGEAAAGGRFDGTVGPGQAVRIFTGAPVPEGADTILLQEDARRTENRVEALEATAAGRHIRRAGLDFEPGELLLERGRLLDPAALSLAAAANHPRLPVFPEPLVAILATGDELVSPGSEIGPDQIVASNSYGVASIIRKCGGRVLDLGIAPDDRATIAAAVEKAREAGARVVVTLGGASVGEHDLIREVMAGLGMELDFWKIAMRPGKPLMFGRLGAARVLGLPGNPVSSLVCAHLFLVPLIARLAGRPYRAPMEDAVLGAAMKENDHRQDYVRARLEETDGRLVATPFPFQDSSMLKTLAAANCLIVRPPHAPAAAAGEPCQTLRLR